MAILVALAASPADGRLQSDTPELAGVWRELPTTLSDQDFSTSLFWTGDRLVTLHPDSSPGVRGEIYDPETGDVRPIADSGLEWRVLPSAVWTGREVVIAGGSNGPGIVHAGAAYDPVSDFWRPIAAPPGFRVGRGENQISAPAVWTGSEMISWRSRLAYDPTADAWRRIARPPLSRRMDEAVVQTPHGTVVWGGCNPPPQCDETITGDELTDGAIYDAERDQWRRLPRSPLRPGDHPTAIWSDPEVVIIVNAPAQPGRTEVAAYNPTTRTWRRLPSPPAPAGRYAVMEFVRAYVVLHSPTGGATHALAPSSGQWYRLPNGPARDRHSAVAINKFRLVLAGGYPSSTPWELQL
jgi:hypothetical protein